MIKPNKVCTICGKGYRRAVARSHSMQATIRRLQPNLQWFTPLGFHKRIKACTKCIKNYSRNKVNMPVAAI